MHLNQIQTAILYIFVIVIMYSLANVAKRKDRFFPLLIGVFLISLIIGLRDTSVGLDTNQYVYLYESGYYTWLKDVGFIQLSKLLSSIAGANLYLYIISLLTYFFFYLGAWKLRKETDLSKLILFLTTTTMFSTMNTIRQYLALSIIFFVYKDIIEKKYIKFGVFVIAATLLHSSSIIAITILFFAILFDSEEKSINKIIIITLSFVVLPIVMYYAYIKYFGSIIQGKLDTYFSSSSIVAGFFGIVQVVVICFVAYKQFYLSDSDEKGRIKFINTIAVIGTLGNLIGYYYSYMNRVFLVYILMIYVLISRQWMNDSLAISNSKTFGKTTLSRIASVFIVMYPFIGVLLKDGYQVMHYRMFFW